MNTKENIKPKEAINRDYRENQKKLNDNRNLCYIRAKYWKGEADKCKGCYLFRQEGCPEKK